MLKRRAVLLAAAGVPLAGWLGACSLDPPKPSPEAVATAEALRRALVAIDGVKTVRTEVIMGRRTFKQDIFADVALDKNPSRGQLVRIGRQVRSATITHQAPTYSTSARLKTYFGSRLLSWVISPRTPEGSVPLEVAAGMGEVVDGAVETNVSGELQSLWDEVDPVVWLRPPPPGMSLVRRSRVLGNGGTNPFAIWIHRGESARGLPLEPLLPVLRASMAGVNLVFLGSRADWQLTPRAEGNAGDETLRRSASTLLRTLRGFARESEVQIGDPWGVTLTVRSTVTVREWSDYYRAAAEPVVTALLGEVNR